MPPQDVRMAVGMTGLPLAPVAQLDRVAGFEPDGWRFESSRARFFALDVAMTTLAGGKYLMLFTVPMAPDPKILHAQTQLISRRPTGVRNTGGDIEKWSLASKQPRTAGPRRWEYPHAGRAETNEHWSSRDQITRHPRAKRTHLCSEQSQAIFPPRQRFFCFAALMRLPPAAARALPELLGRRPGALKSPRMHPRSGRSKNVATHLFEAPGGPMRMSERIG